MGEVISMDEHLASRRKSKARSSPLAANPAQLALAANSLREAFAMRKMVQGDRERLTLAQNLWTILDLALGKAPGLSKAKILREAGQGEPEESTRRLPYFAVDPTLPVDERTRRTKKLRRHVELYARIAIAAANLSGMNPDEILVQLASGTDYEQPQRAATNDPYDDALADIMAILEQRFEQKEAHRAIRDLAHKYFDTLRNHRLTISHEGDEVRGWARPDALAWATVTSRPAGRLTIGNAIKSSVPTAQIGSGFIAAVPGRVSMRVSDSAEKDVQVTVGDSTSPIPKGEKIDLPATINIYARIELGLFPVAPEAAPRLALLIKPRVSVSSDGLTGVYVEKGREGQPDWDFLAMWEHEDDSLVVPLAATSAQFNTSLWFEIPCRPTQYMGEEAVDMGYVVDLSCAIDSEAELGQFRELQWLDKSEWLVEPLTLPSMRKWLLTEMHDTDGERIKVSLPRWFGEWFDGKSHPQEKVQDMIGVVSGSGKRAKEGAEDLKERMRAASEHAAALLKSPTASEPVSCPEGTLAAALERGLVEGNKIHWGPDDPIMLWTLTYFSLLQASLTLAAKRRKALLE